MVDGTDQARGFAGHARPFTPTHVSHKQVEARPIGASAFSADGSGRITLQGGGVVDVPAGFASRATPAEGDMLVRYAPDEAHPDGYLSFSPRAVFDAGYSPIAGAPTASMAETVSVLFATFRDELRKLGDSRELSLALTHLDTARLWAREHAASICGQDRAAEAPSASQDLRSRGEPRVPPAA